MIFRYLMPDCQCLERNVGVEDLEFLGILVSIKNTAPNLTQFHRLDDQHAKIILNEHVLTSFVATRLFESVARILRTNTEHDASSAREFFNDALVGRLSAAGWQGSHELQRQATVADVFDAAKNVCIDVYRTINNYAKRLSFPQRNAVP